MASMVTVDYAKVGVLYILAPGLSQYLQVASPFPTLPYPTLPLEIEIHQSIAHLAHQPSIPWDLLPIEAGKRASR